MGLRVPTYSRADASSAACEPLVTRSERSALRRINHASRAESQGDRGKCQNRPAGPGAAALAHLYGQGGQVGGRPSLGAGLPGQPAAGPASGPGLLAQGEDPSPHRARPPELPAHPPSPAGHHHFVPKHPSSTVLLQSHQRGNRGETAHPGPPEDSWRLEITPSSGTFLHHSDTTTPSAGSGALQLGILSPRGACWATPTPTPACAVHPAPGSCIARRPMPVCRQLPQRLVLWSLSPHTSRSCSTDGEAKAAAGAQGRSGSPGAARV